MLDSVTVDGRGTYYLRKTGQKDSLRCYTIYILGSPITPSIATNGSFYEGTPLRISCTSTSTTIPRNHSLSIQYYWEIDGSSVASGGRFSFDSSVKKELTISNMLRNDRQSVIRCTATEVGGKTSEVTLNVFFGPENIRFFPSGPSLILTNGDTFHPVACIADCNEAGTFAWKKQNGSGSSFTSSNATLDLGLILTSESGIYICSATHMVPGHSLTKTLNVLVIYGPDIVSILRSKTIYTMNEGLTLNVITCSAPCYPNCTFVWTKSSLTVSSEARLDIGQVDRNDGGNYTCTAQNPTSMLRSDSASITIEVTYIASSGPPPSYSAQSYVTVDETVQINTALFTFNVTDDGASISVEPADDTTRRFVTVHVSGGPSPWTVTVRNSIPLDKDIATGGQSSIGLRFSLSDADGNTIVTHTISLYLNDVNDNAPVFLNKPYTWYIDEKPYNASTFYKINATDFDSNRNGKISYFMQPKTNSQHTASEYLDAFSIDIVSGMVHLQKPLDYETNSFYQFTITAMDGGSPQLTTTTDLIISVRDVQDTRPFFTGGPYHAKVQEEVPRGTYVLRVNAVDGDRGSPNNIIYTMLNNTGGNCGNMFTIYQDTGMVAISSFIDRDSGIIKNNSGICRFTVLATENGSSSNTQYGNISITTDVIIKVLDINDNAPIFSQNFYTAYLPDNSSPGSAITVASEILVKDHDEGDNAMMNITLTYPDTGYQCQDFYIDQTTIFGEGSIWIRMSNHANMSDLRYSKTKQIVLKITATGPPPLRFESSALLNITITPGGTFLCNGGHTQNGSDTSTFPIITTHIPTSPLPVSGKGEQQIVSLNVGGSVFQTSLTTLQRAPATSVLMASPLFIDRDPTHFRVILDYLRDKGSFDAGRLPSHILDLHEIIAEAMFYQLDELAHICTTKLTAMIA